MHAYLTACTNFPYARTFTLTEVGTFRHAYYVVVAYTPAVYQSCVLDMVLGKWNIEFQLLLFATTEIARVKGETQV